MHLANIYEVLAVAVMTQRPVPESPISLALGHTQLEVSDQVAHTGTEPWHSPGPPVLKDALLQSTVLLSHSLCPMNNRIWTPMGSQSQSSHYNRRCYQEAGV